MAYTKKEIEKMFSEVLENISIKLMPVNKAFKGVMSNTLFYKCLEDKEKSERYARACEIRADIIFEEILEIADKQGEDVIEDEDGVITVNYNIINRNKLQIDSRKWVLSKMNPKKYGDKMTQDINVNANKEAIKNIFPDESELLENG